MKGEQMKRLALLSAVSLMLAASAIFVPVAMAQQAGEVDVQSVTLGPGGSVTVEGTIECIEGYFYSADVDVRQRTSGNVYNVGDIFTNGTCAETGQQYFQATGFGRVGDNIGKPFHRGPAVIQPRSTLCDPNFNCTYWQGTLQAVHIS